MTQPTEAHWQEAERQYAQYRGITEPYFPREDDWTQAMVQLVADGAKAEVGLIPMQPAKADLQAAADYSNKFIEGTWRRTYEAVKDDRRWWCIASMMRSLGQATADPLSDGERKELAELRAFKARVMEAVK